MIALLSPFAGMLCDRVGTRRILTFSSIFLFVSILTYLVVISVDQLLLVRVVHAVFNELVIAAGLSLASHITSKGGTGIGALRLAQGMGISLGPLLALSLSDKGYYFIFSVAAILSLAPLTSLTMEEARSDEVIPPMETIRYLADLMNLRNVAMLLAAISEVLGFSLLVTYYVSSLITRGLTEAEYASFLFLEAVVFSISSYASEGIYRRFGCGTVMIGAVGLSTVYLLMIFLPSWFVPLAPLLGAFSALCLNPIYIYISDEVRDEERGLAVNSVDLIVNLSFLLLPVLDPPDSGYRCEERASDPHLNAGDLPSDPSSEDQPPLMISLP